MRIWSLLGSIAVLVLPFSFINMSFGDGLTITAFIGLLWYNINTEVDIGIIRGTNEESGSFQLDWIASDGLYSNDLFYFESYWWVGLVIVIALIVNIVLSIQATEKKNKSTPAIVLLAIGIVLLLIRLIVLGDQDLSFYSQSETFFGSESTYLEIPLGFLIALITSIMDFRE